MTRLYLAIIFMCWQYGEVVNLNLLAEELDMHYGLMDRRLRRIEARDTRLRVIRQGRGRPLRIVYEFNGLPPQIPIQRGVITFPPNLFYRG